MAMHSLSSRFNAMVLFTATVLAVMCGINFISGVLLFREIQPSKANIQIVGFKDFDKSSLYKWQTMLLKYNLELNLKELHNWNLKQIFLWIQVDYVSKDGLNSSSSIADWILEPHKKYGTIDHWNINLNNTWAQYPLRDIHNSLRNQDVNVRIMMQYMPHVGVFFKKQLAQTKFTIPGEYAKSSSI